MRKLFQLLSRTFLIIALIIPIFQPLIKVDAAKITTIKDLRVGLSNLYAEKERIESSKNLTQQEINSANNKIFASMQEQNTMEKKIEESKLKIKESEEKIETLNKETQAILKYFQLTKGDEVFNEYLVNANDLKDLIRRLASIEQITEYAENTVKSLNQLIKDNKELQKELADEIINLDKKIKETSKLLGQLNGNLASFSELTVDIDDQIKNQIQQIDYYKKICPSETIDIASCTTIGNSTGWVKPLTKGVITSNWGYRTNPATGALQSFHAGIDIGGNREGTPIYSTANGRISNIIYRSSCGGNIVYMFTVVNGQKYTLEYAHLYSVNVKEGQNVTTATQIGTVGGYTTSIAYGGYDRCTTGAHLHYGVSKGHYGVDYSSWNAYIANNIRPSGYPGVGGRFSSR